MRTVAVEGCVHVSRGAAGHDGRRRAPGLGPGVVLQGGDLVEPVSQGLVLGAPVKEVIPVVTSCNNLLLTVHNTEIRNTLLTSLIILETHFYFDIKYLSL